ELPVQIATLIITALGITIALPYGIKGVAWAITGVSIYSAFHLYWLATRCLRAKLAGFFKAVAPAAVLNALLALVLFSADSTLPASITENDFAYLALMGVVGGATYILSFLYLPFRSLGAERERWKIKLKLAKASA
ncbi:MAG: lipopolysaccharide biosynthesis protein, partial [Kiritimatiellota bacterium]|nr:lipopolysaccharide biosynthesis protein [Kiritimatiellota bacterium]